MDLSQVKDAKLTAKEKAQIMKDYDENIINASAYEYVPESLTEAEKAKMRRKTIVNNKIIISVRNRTTDRTPNLNEYMDLCFYNDETKKIEGLNRIPQSYKDIYGSLVGAKDSIFYCKMEDLKIINEDLKKNKSKIDKINKEKEAFLKELDDM